MISLFLSVIFEMPLFQPLDVLEYLPNKQAHAFPLTIFLMVASGWSIKFAVSSGCF